MARRGAHSIEVTAILPSAPRPRAPRLALQPPARAVAAAAESVDNELAAWGVLTPTLPSFMILSTMTKSSFRMWRRYWRAISRCAIPPPSERNRKMYFGDVVDKRG